MKEREKIPNFNSFSTLVDRISVENVKKSIFELKQEEEGVSYAPQLELQRKVLIELKEQFKTACLKAWVTSEYECIGETRTFS